MSEPTTPALSDEQEARLARGFTERWSDVKVSVSNGLPIGVARHIAPVVAAMLAEARLEGRREAAGAIDFDTTCLNCARVIEKSARAYFDGMKATAEQIAQALDESEDLHNSPGFDVSPRCPGCQAARIARQHGGQR